MLGGQSYNFVIDFNEVKYALKQFACIVLEGLH